MESLIGKKAIYKSPYSGIEVEFEIATENINDIYGGAVLSKNGAYYPFRQIKLKK